MRPPRRRDYALTQPAGLSTRLIPLGRGIGPCFICARRGMSVGTTWARLGEGVSESRSRPLWPQLATDEGGSIVSILWIILIIVIVLALLGFLGRGAW